MAYSLHSCKCHRKYHEAEAFPSLGLKRRQKEFIKRTFLGLYRWTSSFFLRAIRLCLFSCLFRTQRLWRDICLGYAIFSTASNIGVFTVCIIMSKPSWLGFAFVFCTLWKYKTDTCSYTNLTSPQRHWNRKANYPRKTLPHLLWDADPVSKSHFKSACWNLLLVLYASVSVVFTTQHVVNTCVGRGNITKQHTITE